MELDPKSKGLWEELRKYEAQAVPHKKNDKDAVRLNIYRKLFDLALEMVGIELMDRENDFPRTNTASDFEIPFNEETGEYSCPCCVFTTKKPLGIVTHFEKIDIHKDNEKHWRWSQARFSAFRDWERALRDQRRDLYQKAKEYGPAGGNGLYQCTVCNFSNEDPFLIYSHYEIKHSERDPRQCPLCEFKSKNTTGIKEHIVRGVRKHITQLHPEYYKQRIEELMKRGVIKILSNVPPAD